MRIVLVATLLASLAANVILVASRPRAAAAPPVVPAAAPAPGPAATAAAAPPAGARAVPAVCEHALFEAQRDLADLRARLWKTLPLPERFAQSEPAPAAEATLRPEIARIFAARELASASFTLECRGSACQLEILSTGDQADLWMERLQSDPGLRQHVSRTSFRSGRPTNDQATGAPLEASTVFFEMASPGAGSDEPFRLLDGLWSDFVGSPVVASCAAQLTPTERAASVSERGLDIRLDVNAETPGVHAFVGGALGVTAAGRCIAAHLAEAAASRSVPADAPSAVRYVSLTLPPSP